jgi:hypothetical protein
VQHPVESAHIEAALDKALKKGDAHRMAARGDADGTLGDKPPYSAL